MKKEEKHGLIVEILWRYSNNKDKENVVIEFKDADDIADEILAELSGGEDEVSDEKWVDEDGDQFGSYGVHGS